MLNEFLRGLTLPSPAATNLCINRADSRRSEYMGWALLACDRLLKVHNPGAFPEIYRQSN